MRIISKRKIETGKTVGIATFFIYPVIRRGHYRGQLEEMVVTETMRGKGIGSKLIEPVIAYCKQNNIPTMRLNSGLEFTGAHAFYEKHGGKFTEKMYRFDL